MRGRTVRAVTLALVLGVTGSGCLGSGSGPASVGPVPVRVWAHGGTPQEHQTLAAQVRRFNQSQEDARVRVRTIPEGDYNDVVQAAVAAGDLPDVLDLDGPTVASLAYQDALVPLDDLLPADVRRSQLRSLRSQGTIDGRLWAVGTFDSGLGLYGSRSRLEAAGVEVPRDLGSAWTATEFSAALRALAERDADARVLDLKLNYGAGEWLTYGFSPLLSSAGGGLVDRRTGRATGVLDGPGSVRALEALAGWAAFADPNEDDRAFVDGRVALSWVGHWAYPDYAQALGDDLVVLPLPDLGAGPKTGQGSWTWAVSAPERTQGAAAGFLRFLLRDREVLRMADANGAVPGTEGALARSRLYGADGPLRLFADQLVATCGDATPDRRCVAVPRPQTPGYPVVTAEVSRAVADVLAGGDPTAALRAAARVIDADQRANRGYR